MNTFVAPAHAVELLATYSLAKLRTFETYSEGPGFTCELLRNGKRVATVENRADGGPTDFYWTASDAVVATAVRQMDGSSKMVNLNPEHSLFYVLATQIMPPSQFTSDGVTHTIYPDHEDLIERMVERVDTEKRIKRILSREIIVLNDAGVPVSIMAAKGSRAKLKATPENLARVRAKYAGRLVNDMAIDKAIALLVSPE